MTELLYTRMFIVLNIVEKTLSQITCFSCDYTAVDSCGNNTIICREPANTCYIMTSDEKTKIRKSCVWSGHCLPNYICKFGECDLRCCDKDLCNNSNFSTVFKKVPVWWFVFNICITWFIYTGFT